jgi:hypothetical protein
MLVKLLSSYEEIINVGPHLFYLYICINNTVHLVKE